MKCSTVVLILKIASRRERRNETSFISVLGKCGETILKSRIKEYADKLEMRKQWKHYKEKLYSTNLLEHVHKDDLVDVGF